MLFAIAIIVVASLLGAAMVRMLRVDQQAVPARFEDDRVAAAPRAQNPDPHGRSLAARRGRAPGLRLGRGIGGGQEVEQALLAGELQGAPASGEQIFEGERHPRKGTTFCGSAWGRG